VVICLERPGALAGELEAMKVPVRSVNKAPGVRLETFGRLRKIFAKLQPDVVHTHQVGPLFYGAPAARRAGVPLVVHTEHGKVYGERLRSRWLGRIGGRHVHRFFCLTEDLAAEVGSCRIVPRAKLRVITNGIDLSRFDESAEKETLRRSLGLPVGIPLVGTIGRLAEVKSQDVLIRALARVRGQRPDVELVIVGDGPLKQNLQTLTDRLGMRSSVHFVGYRPNPEDYLCALDVFALSSSAEGMPQTVMEAAAAGVPIVATRVGGLPEIIEHGKTGLLCPPGNDAELASGLLQLLADPARARDMSYEAKKRARKFDVRRMAAGYHDFFCQALEIPEHAPLRGQSIIGIG